MKLNWKLFIILLIMSIFGWFAVLPYTLTLQSNVLQNLPVPLSVLLTTQFIQSLIISVIAIFAGLYFAKKVGLGLPIIEGWLEGKPVKDYFISILPISIGLGIIAGVLILGLDYLFSFAGAAINVSTSQLIPPAWQGLLASFYGGINEEILLRLFLMTLLVWIFFKIKKTEDRKTNKNRSMACHHFSLNFIWSWSSTNCSSNYSINSYSSCQDNHFKQYRWNYFRMALLEKRPGISNDSSFFSRHRFTCDSSIVNRCFFVKQLFFFFLN